MFGNEFEVKCVHAFPAYIIESEVRLIKSKSPLSYVLIRQKKNLGI